MAGEKKRETEPTAEERIAGREAVEEHRRELGPNADPKGVPLVRTKDPDGKSQDRAPEPPTADPEPVPRAVHQNFRAPPGMGLFRFKVAARPYHPCPTLYVLARDDQEARSCYLDHTKLAEAVADLRAAGMTVEPPALVCKRLPD